PSSRRVARPRTSGRSGGSGARPGSTDRTRAAPRPPDRPRRRSRAAPSPEGWAASAREPGPPARSGARPGPSDRASARSLVSAPPVVPPSPCPRSLTRPAYRQHGRARSPGRLRGGSRIVARHEEHAAARPRARRLAAEHAGIRERALEPRHLVRAHLGIETLLL